MNVTSGCVGYVIVYNVSYSLDIESTGSDICRNKDSLASRSEPCKRRFTHRLGFPSMYQANFQTYLSQLVCQLIRSPFCSCEYEDGFHLWTPDQFCQQFALQMIRHLIDRMTYCLRRLILSANAEPDGIMHDLSRETFHFSRDRGGEEEGLASLG
jgi:hypothetical protein